MFTENEKFTKGNVKLQFVKKNRQNAKVTIKAQVMLKIDEFF